MSRTIFEHDGCKGCKQNSVDKYTRMTNADRIRSMTDDELAEFLTKQFCHGIGESLIKEWLEREVEE